MAYYPNLIERIFEVEDVTPITRFLLIYIFLKHKFHSSGMAECQVLCVSITKDVYYKAGLVN